MSTSSKELLENLFKLIYEYSKVHRYSITRERLDLYNPNPKNINYIDEKLREPLVEHVGQLPIIASYLYPYIEHVDEVNLGETLTMLSIHDIAETRTGDLPGYFKDKKREEEEYEVSLNILNKRYVHLFEDMEGKKTLTGKFADCVDMLAPFINDLLLPLTITNGRLLARNFDIEKVYTMEKQDFSWDSVLLDLFETIFNEYRQRKINKTSLNLNFIGEDI